MRVTRLTLINLFLLIRLLLFAIVVLSCFFRLRRILLLIGLLAVLLLFLGSIFSLLLFGLNNCLCLNGSNFLFLTRNGKLDILFACKIFCQ